MPNWKIDFIPLVGKNRRGEEIKHDIDIIVLDHMQVGYASTSRPGRYTFINRDLSQSEQAGVAKAVRDKYGKGDRFDSSIVRKWEGNQSDNGNDTGPGPNAAD